MAINLFKILVAVLFLMLCGCGTIRTLANEKNHVVIKAGNKRSYCTEIPYIFSGVAHDFCMLYGEEGYKSHGREHAFWGIPYLFFDFPLCTIADTVVLPYTIYKQISVGNITVGNIGTN